MCDFFYVETMEAYSKWKPENDFVEMGLMPIAVFNNENTFKSSVLWRLDDFRQNVDEDYQNYKGPRIEVSRLIDQFLPIYDYLLYNPINSINSIKAIPHHL